MAEIGKPVINFQILNTYDPKMLIIADFSKWLHIENQPAVISIKLPGSKKYIEYNFVKNKINAFNSNTLGISCDVGCNDPDYSDLPDGIYDVCLQGSPNTFKKQKYYLKIDRTRIELDKQFIKLGFEYSLDNKAYIDHLQTVDILLMAASSATRLGEIPKAHDNFMEALKLLEKYKDCKTCF